MYDEHKWQVELLFFEMFHYGMPDNHIVVLAGKILEIISRIGSVVKFGGRAHTISVLRGNNEGPRVPRFAHVCARVRVCAC